MKTVQNLLEGGDASRLYIIETLMKYVKMGPCMLKAT